MHLADKNMCCYNAAIASCHVWWNNPWGDIIPVVEKNMYGDIIHVLDRNMYSDASGKKGVIMHLTDRNLLL